MTRYIRNKTSNDVTIRGRTVSANSFYLIPSQEYGSWGLDDTLIGYLQTPADFTMSADGATDYSSSVSRNIAFLQSGPLLDASNKYPFAKKVHSDGRKLTNKTRGMDAISLSGSSASTTFTIPFECLMTGADIVNAKPGDCFKFEILDSDTGIISGYPNTSLNEFGDKVWASEGRYKYESSYDAGLIQGLQVKVTCTATEDTSTRKVFVNLFLHKLG